MESILKRLRSKTYWLGIGTFLLGMLEVAQATGQMPAMFDGKVRAGITVALAVAIFVLREMTKTPVGDK